MSAAQEAKEQAKRNKKIRDEKHHAVQRVSRVYRQLKPFGNTYMTVCVE